MKKLAGLIFGAVLAMCVLSVNVAAGESAKLKSIGFSSGNGALTSGPFFEANFSKGQDVFNLSLGEKDMYVYYLKSLADNKIFFGPCLEFFYNVPVVSVMLSLNPVKHVSTLSWLGYSAGNPGEKVEPLNWKLCFFYQSLSLSYKRLTATGAAMYFSGWLYLADLKYDQPINEKIGIYVNVGRNLTSKAAILKLGMNYNL